MIVFACSVPHPPIVIPEIGKGNQKRVAATALAMEKVAARLEQSKPQSMIIISPHGKWYQESMGILKAPSSIGDLNDWGMRQETRHYDSDLELVRLIESACKISKIPLRSIGDAGYYLDHGVMVPMYFLGHAASGVPLVCISFSMLPLSVHYEFGKAIGRAIDKSGKRVAIVASGDLSHRLTTDAPAGYDPAGKKFDEQLVAAIGRLDYQSIMKMDPDFIEKAGECGLRPNVILLGALSGLKVKPEILSYEGPFGVGYMVASFTLSDVPKTTEFKPVKRISTLVKLARETVESYARTHHLPEPKTIPTTMKKRAGVFVSIKEHGELRGCIGTFEPTQPDLAHEIIANAFSAANRDPRFAPITEEELADLTYSVDVLTKPQPVEDAARLDPKKYGVIVECGRRRALLLPDLEGVDTVSQQIAICRQKGGIMPNEPVKLYSFEVKRYK
jgi:AmmeMemoRadiSam system protein A